MECVATEPLVSPVHFEPQGELNCIRPLQGLGSVGTWGPGKSWARGQAAASWRGSPGNADPTRPSLPRLPAAQGSFPTSLILKALPPCAGDDSCCSKQPHGPNRASICTLSQRRISIDNTPGLQPRCWEGTGLCWDNSRADRLAAP